jgi:nucleoside triphosphate pyrophosphatase
MLILASASPRRREILESAGIPFETRPADVDETPLLHETAEEYVQRLAEEKARAVWRTGDTVIGADTVVAVDKVLLGKPRDGEEAARMLRLLSGRRHRVLTGVCFFDGERAETALEETFVEFLPLSDEEIAAYVATGEPFDKAGAYGIQGAASKFVARIEGCYFNVVGLPIARVYGFLRSRRGKE